ncbi:unnamed protein product, partial [Mesorhabditis belari]|uniref:Uncharacterized protein n=1 Tax=Mesorhabditis belari TaxID=2138241 RepID=A0AAF3F0P5_9BILA
MNSKPSSPAWRNPRDVLKNSIRRRTRRSLAPDVANSPAADSPKEPPSRANSTNSTPKLNPFRRSPRKRPLQNNTCSTNQTGSSLIDWDDSTANDSFNSPLMKSFCNEERKFGFINRSLSCNNAEDSLYDSLCIFNEGMPTDFSENDRALFSIATPKEKEEFRTSETLPVDWRLGTKLIITSQRPFPWMKGDNTRPGSVPVKIVEPDLFNGIELFKDGLKSCLSNAPLACLEAASMCYLYPELPGMSFFPRMKSLEKSTAKGIQFTTAQKEELIGQWEECFASLFDSWRRGMRDHFYVCASPFTVFFTSYKTSEAEPSQMVDETASQTSCSAQFLHGKRKAAIVSHSNFLLRELLRKEGIKFEFSKRANGRGSERGSPQVDLDCFSADITNSQPPLFGDLQKTPVKEVGCSNSFGMHNMNGSDSDDDPDENSPTKAVYDSAKAKNNGVTPKLSRYRSFDHARYKDDRRPNAIYINDSSSLKKLRDMLIDKETKHLTGTLSGPFAGLPPTLIASRQFLRAPLVPYRKTSKIVRQTSGDLKYICEIEGGPILNEHVMAVSSFLKSSNMVSNENAVSIRVNDKNVCNGLNSIGQNVEWTEIFVEPNGFRWKIEAGK